jgi:hypothetical protein
MLQRAAGVIYFVVVHVSSDISLDIVYDALYLTVSTLPMPKDSCASFQNESETTFLYLSVPVELFFTSDPFANKCDA